MSRYPLPSYEEDVAVDVPELLPLGKGILVYTIQVRGSDRLAQFAVVFRGEATEESRVTALGRMQWFVSAFLGPSELRDMSVDETVQAELPVDTLFLTSEFEHESFWCGPSPTDQDLVRRVIGLPKMLRWNWAERRSIVVSDMKIAIGEA